MAIGDKDDIFKRLKSYIPPWFNSSTPILDAVLKGAATGWSFVYGLYDYAKKQTRIKTSTDEFLDLEAQDFLGNQLQRYPEENDDSYRNRLLANIFPYPPTREGMKQALINLTGRAPIIYEPSADGCFLNVNAFLNHGAYGFDQPYTAYIIAYRPQAKFSDYAYALDQTAFLDRNAFAFSDADFDRHVKDEDIYSLINRVKPYGTNIWVKIED